MLTSAKREAAMLVLSRKEGESIEFRDLDVCVRVIQLKKSKVQLGIEAPRTIQVDRTETLGRYADKEYCGGHQMLSPLVKNLHRSGFRRIMASPRNAW